MGRHGLNRVEGMGVRARGLQMSFKGQGSPGLRQVWRTSHKRELVNGQAGSGRLCGLGLSRRRPVWRIAAHGAG